MDFKLRPSTMEDAPVLPEYANNFNIARFMMDRFPLPYTIEDANDFISFAIKDNPAPCSQLISMGGLPVVSGFIRRIGLYG